MRVKHRQNLDLPRVDAGRLVGQRNEHHEQPRRPHQVLCHVQAHLGQLRTADRHLVQVQHQDLCMCSSMLSVCVSAQSCASLRVGKNMTWSDLALEATGTTGNYLCPIPQCSFHKNAKTCINIPTSSNTGQTYRRRLRVVMFVDDVSILVHTVSVS